MLLLKKLTIILFLFSNINSVSTLPTPEEAADKTLSILSDYLYFLVSIRMNGNITDSTEDEILIEKIKKLVKSHDESEAYIYKEQKILALLSSHDKDEYKNLSDLFNEDAQAYEEMIFPSHSLSEIKNIIFNTKAYLLTRRNRKFFLENIIAEKQRNPDGLRSFWLNILSKKDTKGSIQDELELNDVNYELIAVSIASGAINEVTESDIKTLKTKDLDNLNQQEEIANSDTGYTYRTENGGLYKYIVAPFQETKLQLIGKWAYSYETKKL